MSSPEVVIVGAGIVGVSVAWELHRRGVQVCLLDRLGVAEGTTGLGEGNVLCSDKDAGPELELTKLGLRIFGELEERLGEQARIRRKGALIVHPDSRTWDAEPERVERLRAARVRADLLAPAEVREREPELTGELFGASHFPDDLQCDPRSITRALARELPDVRTGVDVAGVAVDGGRVAGVEMADGSRLATGAVVIAAGPWSAPLARSAGLDLPLEPRKGQLVRLRLPQPDAGFLRHKVVDGSYLLSVTSGSEHRQVSTVVETTWDGDVIVGSSRERCGFDPGVDPLLSADLRERASRLVPSLAGLEAATDWVGFRPWLPDHLPAIGPSAVADGLWLATGHEGAGVALGPATGRVLAQALTGERPDFPLAPFTPDRFAPRAANVRGPDV